MKASTRAKFALSREQQKAKEEWDKKKATMDFADISLEEELKEIDEHSKIEEYSSCVSTVKWFADAIEKEYKIEFDKSFLSPLTREYYDNKKVEGALDLEVQDWLVDKIHSIYKIQIDVNNELLEQVSRIKNKEPRKNLIA